MRLRIVPPTLAAALLCFAPAVFADAFRPTRSDQLVERSHQIRVVVDRGHARATAVRTVFNGGEEHDQAFFDLSIPDTAVAVGLRTLGTLNGVPHWFEGELLEAEEAATRYRELTGVGGYTPKDPALLSWRERGHLYLQVFPCPPGQLKSVEYTFEMPTVYEEGRHVLELPQLGTEAIAATVTARAARSRDRLLFDGKPVAQNFGLVLDEPRRLELVPFDPEPVEGMLGTSDTGLGTAVSRWHLDVAARISEVPKGARVVVAIDASRSMEQWRHEAATAAAVAYLSHFVDARVEIIDFDRHARRRMGQFVAPAVAMQSLGTSHKALGNGSNVDLALDLADQLLATEEGPRRIVLITDGSTRSTLTTRDLSAALSRSEAILHLATVDVGAPQLLRDDDHAWAQVARTTGGLFWSASASSAAQEADEMRTTYEEWARPLRIDKVSLYAEGLEDQVDVPDVLEEGSGIERLSLKEPVHWVELTGELWSQPFRKVLHTNAEESKRWAALVFGQPDYSDLGEPEMMTLATYGGAVSPVTSYLAIEPGVRPSTVGLDWGSGGLGLSGIGEGGGGRGEGIGLGSIGSLASRAFDPEQELRQRLASGWKHCGGDPDSAEVVMETTLDEVVDVPAATLDDPDVALRSCLVEVAWAISLPSEFSRYPFRRFELRI